MRVYLLFFLLIPLALWSQADVPSLFEVVNIHVKQGHEKDFETAVKSHNQQYHNGGAHNAATFYNISGKWGGTYSWTMGPTNWAAMDTRPDSDAHNADWDKVQMHIETIEPPTYWSGDVEHSHLPTADPQTKSTVWMFDFKPGKAASWVEQLKKIKAVYETKYRNETMFLGWNTHANTDGHDAVLIFGHDKWADKDTPNAIGKDFESVHGAGSWNRFLNIVEDCVKGRNDWIRELVD